MQTFTWDATGTTLHIPALPQGLSGIAILTLFGVALTLVLWARKAWPKRAPVVLRIRTFWRRSTGFLKSIYLAVLLVIGTGGIILVLYEYVFQIPPLISGILTQLKGQIGLGYTESLRNLAYAFAALAGSLAFLATIPFQLVRVWINERTARTAEENLTTDLINKAVEGLGAEKSVKVHVNGQTVEETKPNIEVRVGAIYALERIAQDSDRDHVRIMEILCAYIRGNAPARDAKSHGLGEWEPLKADATEEERSAYAEAFVDRFGNPFEKEGKLKMWARDLGEPPTDISAAIEVIGRRSDWQTDLEKKARGRGDASGYRLDLRATNLQAADLSQLNLKGADFTGAHLEGANLGEAHLEGANLWGAHLEGANLGSAHLEGANLGEAHLEGADLRFAHLEGADLGRAHLEGADLRFAHLEGADLGRAHLEGADLWEAHLEGADLGSAHLEGADLGSAHLEGADLGSAHLEGANLREAHLEGANLRGAHLNVRTDFRAATLRGAALKSVILTIPHVNLDLLTEAYGDATVTLPDGWKAGKGKLGHWSTEDLNWRNFIAAWRKHQAKIGYTPPNP